jgi:hypothetical protein
VIDFGIAKVLRRGLLSREKPGHSCKKTTARSVRPIPRIRRGVILSR